MKTLRRAFWLLLIFQGVITVDAKTVYDAPDSQVHELFSAGRAEYVIRYVHLFSDTLRVPAGSEIRFDGGQLSGPIFFKDTKLSGNVNLKGSSIGGRLTNKTFDASWLCAMDGFADDAKNINEMIEVCGHVYFPKGMYRLVSRFDPTGKVSKNHHKSINSHIGICKSNIELIGESGTNFLTDDSLGTICLFSMPNDISKSIENINIKNITFNVKNDGKHFHEFMHTIKTIGVNGLTIDNCTFNDFWGDAICLSHYGDNPKTGERTRNQNVKILNNTIIGGNHHNNRNGISVINGKDVLIKGNTIKNTSRKDMPGGIDVEPNNSAYTIVNIKIEKNNIEDVYSHAITVFVKKGGSTHHIEILSNEIKRCGKAGIAVAILTEGTTDSIIIKNNHVFADTRPYLFRGDGLSKDWVVSGNTFERSVSQSIPGDITVENLLLKNNKKKESLMIDDYWGYGFMVLAAFLCLVFIKFLHNGGYVKKHSLFGQK